MSSTTPTAEAKILSTLRRGSKRGLTVFTIAERTGLNLNTVRSTLYTLSRGTAPVTIIGTQQGEFGRPANLYAYTA